MQSIFSRKTHSNCKSDFEKHQNNLDKENLRIVYQTIKKLRCIQSLPKNFCLSSEEKQQGSQREQQKTVKVNHLILANESSYFHQYISESNDEFHYPLSQEALSFFDSYFNHEAVTKINERNIPLIVEILRFSSKWKLTSLLERMEEWCPVSSSILKSAYLTACELEDKSLKRSIKSFFENAINTNNYLEIFDLANDLKFKDLEYSCLKFFKKHLWNLFQQFPSELEDIRSFVKEIRNSDVQPFQNAFSFFAQNIEHFSDKFLETLSLPELLILLIVLPEKVKSLNVKSYSETQIEILLPWLPKNLKSLNLTQSKMSQDTLQRIHEACPSLVSSPEKDKVQQSNSNYDGEGISPLIEELVVEDENIAIIASNLPNPSNIKKLVIHFNDKSPGPIKEILQKCPHVKYLHLNSYNCQWDISIQILEMINTYCKKIKTFDWNTYLPIIPGRYIAQFTNLKKLAIYNISGSYIVDLQEIFDSQSELKDLHIEHGFDESFCSITNEKINNIESLSISISPKNFLEFFPNLKKLNVKPKIQAALTEHKDIENIQFQLSKLKKLEVINLRLPMFLNYIQFIPNIHTLQLLYPSILFMGTSGIDHLDNLLDKRPDLKVYLLNGDYYVKEEILRKAREISQLCQLVL